MADIPSLLSLFNEKVSAICSLKEHEYFLKTDSKYQQSIADLSILNGALFKKIIGKLDHLGTISWDDQYYYDPFLRYSHFLCV